MNNKVDLLFKDENMHWKHLVFSLNEFIDEPDNPFSKNASDGVYYLMGIAFAPNCKTCDAAAMDWLHEFKTAWLLRKELSLFRGCTCGNEE